MDQYRDKFQGLLRELFQFDCADLDFGIYRKKRNIGGYERAGAVSDMEANEMLNLAKMLREDVEKWIRVNHLELLPS
jgi:hypothetical protein